MTARLSLPDDRVMILGALDLERTPAGVRPRRLPAWTRPRLSDSRMDLVVSQAAGGLRCGCVRQRGRWRWAYT
ncbi:hypothetical protein [Fodinicola feengrottensis]|uniref:hypothetical protein n=1 Tax=Fodinicola feengrottensis TaxID=435914 RepID=UPI002441A525|nr:hypothetical protein [Fodinicola feengrottensis]